MQFFFGLAALQLICAAGLVPAARVTGPQDRPAAGQVRIVGTPVVDYTSGSNSSTGGVVTTWDPTDELVTEGGNGCMTGSVGSVIAADNSFMTIIFSQFFAEVGPYVRNRHRAYCRLNVTLNSPGWTLDIDSMDFRGYYKLDPGVNATIKTKYKFGEQQGKGRVSKRLEGPLQTDFILHKDGETEERDQHPCLGDTTTLQISITIKIESPDDDKFKGLVKGDSADGRFNQVMNIGWRKCQDITPLPSGNSDDSEERSRTRTRTRSRDRESTEESEERTRTRTRTRDRESSEEEERTRTRTRTRDSESSEEEERTRTRTRTRDWESSSEEEERSRTRTRTRTRDRDDEEEYSTRDATRTRSSEASRTSGGGNYQTTSPPIITNMPGGVGRRV